MKGFVGCPITLFFQEAFPEAAYNDMRVVQASGLMLLHVTHVRNKHRHPLLGLAGAPCVVLQTCVHSRNRRGEGAPTGVWVTGNRNAH